MNDEQEVCGECKFFKPNEPDDFGLSDTDWGGCFPFKNSLQCHAKCHKDAKACEHFSNRKRKAAKRKKKR